MSASERESRSELKKLCQYTKGHLKCPGRDLWRFIFILNRMLEKQAATINDSPCFCQVSTANARKSPYSPCSVLILNEKPGILCFHVSCIPKGILLEPTPICSHRPQTFWLNCSSSSHDHERLCHVWVCQSEVHILFFFNCTIHKL